MAAGLAILLGLYLALILWLWLGWERTGPCQEPAEWPGISVVVAVRNEAAALPALLEALAVQDYPGLYEVVVVDDHSEDSTPQLLASWRQQGRLNLKVLHLPTGIAGKKAALAAGIAAAGCDHLLVTDGDCRPAAGWLRAMGACLAAPGARFVAGPVRLWPAGSWWARWQAVEFSALIGAGAGCLAWGMPVMANAANMGFTRQAYYQAGGMGQENTSSGDDVFLLHRLARQGGRGLFFCRQSGALVDTLPAPGWRPFLAQRQRWAAKWQHYDYAPARWLAVFVFLANLAVVLLPLLAAGGMPGGGLVANLIIAKFAFEYLYLRELQKFFHIRLKVPEFAGLAVIYPFYVVYTALASLRGTFNWKGRQTR